MALLQAKKQRRLVAAYQQPAVQMPPDIRQREPQPVAPTAPTTLHLREWACSTELFQRTRRYKQRCMGFGVEG